MTTKEQNRIKAEWLTMLEKLFTEKGYNVERATNSKIKLTNYNNVALTITIPKGMRTAGGFIEYDGYMAATDFEIENENKTQSRTSGPREHIMSILTEELTKEEYLYTDALIVGNCELSFPVLDIDRNEIFVNIEISVPKTA